jgi:transcriptional regulator with XRE-family HTH domain
MYKDNMIVHTFNMRNKIGEYRYKQNMSLAELSRRSGISTTALYNIENGYTKDIFLSHAIVLSKILQVDLYELFCIKR